MGRAAALFRVFLSCFNQGFFGRGNWSLNYLRLGRTLNYSDAHLFKQYPSISMSNYFKILKLIILISWYSVCKVFFCYSAILILQWWTTSSPITQSPTELGALLVPGYTSTLSVIPYHMVQAWQRHWTSQSAIRPSHYLNKQPGQPAIWSAWNLLAEQPTMGDTATHSELRLSANKPAAQQPGHNQQHDHAHRAKPQAAHSCRHLQHAKQPANMIPMHSHALSEVNSYMQYSLPCQALYNIMSILPIHALFEVMTIPIPNQTKLACHALFEVRSSHSQLSLSPQAVQIKPRLDQAPVACWITNPRLPAPQVSRHGTSPHRHPVPHTSSPPLSQSTANQ